MSSPTNRRASPFQRATTTDRRLKYFVWGDAGRGKSILTSQFINLVVTDLEGGTEHCGRVLKYDDLKVTVADDDNSPF